jgi:hypothetical protein
VAQILKAVIGAFSAGAGAASGTITTGTGGGGVGALAGATGGLVRGPGTGTSDSIPVWLSDEEFVVKAAAVRRPGILPLLRTINDDVQSFNTMRIRPVGRVRGFASGGLVEADGVRGGAAGGRSTLDVGLDRGLLLKDLKASPEFHRVILRIIGDNPRTVKGLLR